MKLQHIDGAVLPGAGEADPAGWPVADVLGSCLERVRLIVRPDDPRRSARRRSARDWPWIEDGHPDPTPLTGVCTALRAADAPAVLCVSADLIGLRAELVLAMLALTPTSGDHAIITWDRRMDSSSASSPDQRSDAVPLLAVYRTHLLPELEACITSGDRSLHALIEQQPVLRIPLDVLRELNPMPTSAPSAV